MKKTITLKVNGETFNLDVEDRRTLAEVIREDLHLLGTHMICEKGECGACTVIMDGLAINSCLVLAADANGKEIETIEGLAQGFELHPIQKNFVEKGAVQCGMCTSGMIMTAKAFLQKKPHPDEEEVRHAIAGNFCRCTGYVRIVDAVLSSASELKES
ncbi:MAG: aerobic carbon-monoxide dehydrogenase small subunit [Thermodesulfobacteriota bacterium]|nr:aerobic carbon-monoxide dehydrogenase small subunit [Thermodesulfobacteriota bacterium]